MGIYLIEGWILGLPAFQGSPPLAELSPQHKAFIWNNKLAAVSLAFFHSLPAFRNRHTFSSAKQSNKTHTCAAAECPPPPCFQQSPATLNHSHPTPFSSLIFSALEVKGGSLIGLYWSRKGIRMTRASQGLVETIREKTQLFQGSTEALSEGVDFLFSLSSFFEWSPL